MNEEVAGQIQAVPQPKCFLCGAPGSPLHDDLQDRLFNAPGRWNLTRCENTGCGLVWLNPMPKERDIGQAYEEYYTHVDTSEQNGASVAVRKSGLLSWLSRITGLQTRKHRSFLLYLEDAEPGKLLEIGCGDGQRLAAFRSLGWDVIGQETDPHAADSVRKSHGIDVLVGPVEEQGLAEESFDAIAMNHVMEHVHDPLSLIRECFHLLKPGGVLSIVTPNNQSFGHSIFKRDWRGLEPPRHLYIYSCSALERLVSLAGFHDCSIGTTAINAAGTVTQESFRLRKMSRTGNAYISPAKVKILSHFFRIFEFALLLVKKNAGEECVLMATRKNAKNG